jgi:predicted Zn-dependent protease
LKAGTSARPSVYDWAPTLGSVAFGALAIMMASCSLTPHRPARPPASPATAAAAGSASVPDLAAAIKTAADRSEHESDPKMRAELAAQANAAAAQCMAQQPDAAACLYGSALADGLEARLHPTHAVEQLKKMLDLLGRAESADATYDEGGPSRVKALVLVRAPAWPLGPGDADGAVLAARRAVELRPKYPPNQLALAEALAKTGNATDAHDVFERARQAALSQPASPDRDTWLKQAEEGLQRR